MQKSHLLQEYRFKAKILKNRIIMAPMVTLYAARDGSVTERMVNYYGARARGGVGLIVVESTYTCQEGHPGRLGIYDDRFLPGLAKVVNAIHSEGASVAIQLNINRGRFSEVDPVSASDMPDFVTGIRPRPLKAAEINALINEFGKGVQRAKEIGFDGIMIHGASGYLVSDFLSPLTNKRQDQYGGDLAGRARLALALVNEVKKNGDGLINCFRLGADEHTVGGFSVEEAVIFSRWLEEAGADLIDVVSGTAPSREWVVPPMFLPRGCNVYLAELIKNAVNVPVGVAGRINNYDLAEDIIAKKKADFVTLGRPLIADPDYCQKFMAGRKMELRPCIACNECYNRQPGRDNSLSCTVNPLVGREEKEVTAKALKRKKVAIFGGGPGGMEAARICGLRGHQVTLFEKNRLGNTLREIASLEFKKELLSLVSYYEQEMKKWKIDIRRFEKIPSNIKEYEEVIVAVGGAPFIPDVPGTDSPQVLSWRVALQGQRDIGDRVLVIGAGMVGLELAFAMALKGKQVVIADMKSEIFNEYDNPTKSLYEKLCVLLRIVILTGRKLTAFSKGMVHLEREDGGVDQIEADTIILATGQKPQSSFLAELKREYGKDVIVIGDCLKPRKIKDAIREGYEAACKL